MNDERTTSYLLHEVTEREAEQFDERTTAYLLNELTEREAEQFEEECFARPEWPAEELDFAEQELIQAYIKNELSPERRRRFEEHYLTTAARKQRVVITRSLLRRVCRQRTLGQRALDFLQSMVWAPRLLVPRFAAILLIVGLAATLLWYVIPPRAPQTFAHLNLVSTSDERSTSGPPHEVRLPLAKDALRLSLALPEPASSGTTYRVQWEDVRGAIEDLDIEKQEANSLSVIIPADDLKRGQYALILHQKNPDGTEQRLPGSYLFNVVE